MNGKIKIVYLATPDIAVNSFNFFINSDDYEVSALVTQPQKGKTRGKIHTHNITKIAKKNNIKVFEPEKISTDIVLIEKLKSLEPDFFVTFAFGQILSEVAINIPKYATINLHASLLPKYRGANPISQAIMDGSQLTGITTIKTVLELDAGDICKQKEIKIPFDMNVIQLMEEVSALSPVLLDETLKGLYNNTIVPRKQNNEEATFTKKLKKEDKKIDWNMDYIQLHNKIRGMYKINTNYTTFNNKPVQILKTKIQTSTKGLKGEIIDITKDGITVQCSNGAIKIETVKPEGKNEMSAISWANGARIKKGDKFI